MLQVTFKIEQVQSVYSGRQGCCCGCRGKHTYASALSAEAQKQRGYEIRDGEINDAVVRRHVRTIQKLIAENAGEYAVLSTSEFVSVDANGRTYIAYFKQN